MTIDQAGPSLRADRPEVCASAWIPSTTASRWPMASEGPAGADGDQRPADCVVRRDGGRDGQAEQGGGGETVLRQGRVGLPSMAALARVGIARRRLR